MKTKKGNKFENGVMVMLGAIFLALIIGFAGIAAIIVCVAVGYPWAIAIGIFFTIFMVAVMIKGTSLLEKLDKEFPDGE
jgi:cobalamin biosynthesis protein CobD/CbiB